ncbi:MAG: hypothetical protein ACI304_02615 [Lepagella sp.]
MEDIDAIIIDRLGEHQRKVEFVTENLTRAKARRHPLRGMKTSMIWAAASLLIILLISPMIIKSIGGSSDSLTEPTFSEYRGAGSNEIEALIKAGEYEKALETTERELATIHRELDAIPTSEMSLEEREYTLALYDAELEEMLWCKIYLLHQLERQSDLDACCKEYLSHESFSKNRKEVEGLMKK